MKKPIENIEVQVDTHYGIAQAVVRRGPIINNKHREDYRYYWHITKLSLRRLHCAQLELLKRGENVE